MQRAQCSGIILDYFELLNTYLPNDVSKMHSETNISNIAKVSQNKVRVSNVEGPVL